MNNLLKMKSRGEINGKPCGLGTSWTYERKHIGKHRIGRMAGQRHAFKVFPEIICTGNAPSLIEVITAIKRTKDTKIGKNVSIIEMPVDVLEHCGYATFAQNTKAFITSHFETLFGLKNENGELEMYYMGEKRSKCDGRKQVRIPRSMFVDRLREKNTKTMQIGRFDVLLG